jgi:hypothetical protein
MAELRTPHVSTLVVEHNQSLIAVPVVVDGREATQYFVEEAAGSVTTDKITEEALSVIGAWSDLDWDEMEEALHRIRHQSTPTPPIDSIDL